MLHPLIATMWLRHEYFNQGNMEPFHFSFKELSESGKSVKDYIAPPGFDFRYPNRFRSGKMFGCVHYLDIIAPTGSYVYKVVADKKDANVNRSLTKKKMYRKFMYEAEAATKAKAMEDADDNDAVNAASGVESSGERLYDFAMEHSKSGAQRKYDRLSNAQKKMARAEAIYAKRKFQYDTNEAYAKWLSQNEKMQGNSPSKLLQKQFQKSRIKRQYIKAQRIAKDTGKTAEIAVESAKKTTLIAHKIQEFIARNAKTIIIVGLLALLMVSIMSALSSCAAMLGGSVSTTMASTYLSEPSEIDAAALKVSELETELQEEINAIETDYPGYDEYDYNLGEMKKCTRSVI